MTFMILADRNGNHIGKQHRNHTHQKRDGESLDDFSDVFSDGRADAALAASIFHFSEHSVRKLKELLRSRNIPVRL